MEEVKSLRAKIFSLSLVFSIVLLFAGGVELTHLFLSPIGSAVATLHLKLSVNYWLAGGALFASSFIFRFFYEDNSILRGSLYSISIISLLVVSSFGSLALITSDYGTPSSNNATILGIISSLVIILIIVLEARFKLVNDKETKVYN